MRNNYIIWVGYFLLGLIPFIGLYNLKSIFEAASYSSNILVLAIFLMGLTFIYWLGIIGWETNLTGLSKPVVFLVISLIPIVNLQVFYWIGKGIIKSMSSLYKALHLQR